MHRSSCPGLWRPGAAAAEAHTPGAPALQQGKPLSGMPVHHSWRKACMATETRRSQTEIIALGFSVPQLEKSLHGNRDPAQPNRNNSTGFQKESKTLKLLEEKKLERSQPQLRVRQRFITWRKVLYALVFYCCCNKLPQYKTLKQAKFFIL